MEEIPVRKRIGGILALLGENFVIPNESKINSYFHQLSTKEEYHEIFKGVNFLWKDKDKKTEIEKIIINLKVLELIKKSGVGYRISKSLAEYYKKNSKEIFKEKEGLIRKISGELRDYLNRKE